MEYQHVPVLWEPLVEMLALGPAQIVLDATVGLGGHAEEILKRLPGARLIGLDVDPEAVARAATRLAPYGDRVQLRCGSYARLDEHLQALNVTAVSGIVFDLGVSSLQIDAAERGFSYRSSGPLDMRMDPAAPHNAADLLNSAEEHEIARVLRDYGEERFARRIARGDNQVCSSAQCDAWRGRAHHGPLTPRLCRPADLGVVEARAPLVGEHVPRPCIGQI